tara:strand:+ start:371 stop:664 length:294 start_codon:yes stop_codon:yes gene_type:complete
MGEADKFLNIMLYWEKIKYTVIGVGMGILAIILTGMYGNEVYHKYTDKEVEKTPLLDSKMTPLIIILFWVISIVLLYFRNSKTFQKIGLFSDIALRR